MSCLERVAPATHAGQGSISPEARINSASSMPDSDNYPAWVSEICERVVARPAGIKGIRAVALGGSAAGAGLTFTQAPDAACLRRFADRVAGATVGSMQNDGRESLRGFPSTFWCS